jgi:hypothetical protein
LRVTTKIMTMIKTKKTKKILNTMRTAEQSAITKRPLQKKKVKKEMRMTTRTSRLCHQILKKSPKLMCLLNIRIKRAFLWMRDSLSRKTLICHKSALTTGKRIVCREWIACAFSILLKLY